MDKTVYELARFTCEPGVAIAVQAMNEYYPNVAFEGVEVGDGTYRVTAWRKNDDREIHPHTLKMFTNELYTAYRIACVAVRIAELTR